MTEEAIILDTLRFIKRETNPPTHVNITDKIWWNFDLKRQEDLREVLRSTTMINYNQFNHWEFQLRSEAYPIIKDANKKLESDFLKSLQRQRNIELFMCNNFIKPNPKSEYTTHEHDNAIIFLKDLKGQGLIEYDKDDLNHISKDWYEEDPPINKRWFDTVDKNHPFLVELTEFGKNYLLLDEARPINTPTAQLPTKHKKTIQTGTHSKNIWKNDLIVFIGYPLIVGMLVMILLKIFGVI